jgi:hypothetical protein
MFNSFLRMGFYFTLLVTFGVLVLPTQGQSSGGTMVYENRNQIEPKPLRLHVIRGVARAEDGSAIPAMEVGIFTEKDHVLVTTTMTDQKGQFDFSHVPAGRYRLVAKHPAFCTANMPILLESSALGHSGRAVELHMKVGGIDVCSFGSLVPSSQLNNH